MTTSKVQPAGTQDAPTAAAYPDGLRVAVIGTGLFSGFHYDAWNRIPETEVVALAGRSNRDRAEEVAREFDIPRVYMDVEQLLTEVEPDLVDIVTPPDSHLDLVRLVAGNGIPMVCQKPLAPSLQDSNRLVEAAQEAGVLLVIHENWRFKPWIREIGRLVDAGTVGTPEMITFRFRPGDGRGEDAFLDRQPRFREMPRFLIHETGIHMVDCFRFLMGEVKGLFAHLWQLNPVIAGEDAGYVIFDFADGSSGVFDGHRGAEHVADNMRFTVGHLVLDGSEGYVRLDGFGNLFVKPHKKPEYQHQYEFVDRGYAGDSAFALQRHVVEHLVRGGPVENAGREYLNNSYVEDAIYRSSEERVWVDLTERPAAVVGNNVASSTPDAVTDP